MADRRKHGVRWQRAGESSWVAVIIVHGVAVMYLRVDKIDRGDWDWGVSPGDDWTTLHKSAEADVGCRRLRDAKTAAEAHAYVLLSAGAEAIGGPDGR